VKKIIKVIGGSNKLYLVCYMQLSIWKNIAHFTKLLFCAS